ncbi:MAG: YihY/virulence factor BrkB family protein [Porphyromonadaceae bacterium]|nr:YihY/virulence factor BrkB family protein [Porphyromonadaceae bacterium]
MKKLIESIKIFFNFIRFDIWRITSAELPKGKNILYNIIKTIYLSVKGYTNDKLGIRSAALTYSISFAIVPLFALISAIARGFGIENIIEKTLQDTFSAQADMIPTIMGFVRKYLETMSGGIFIGIGILILIYSVFNLFSQIEMVLNNIWQVQKSRSVLKQFTIYFSGVLIFPVLIAVSGGFSIYINNILKSTFLFQLFTPFVKFLLVLVPYITSGLIFTLVYQIVPNTKVRFINAFIAGMIAGVLFQFLQSLYVSGQINLTRYNAIYGGFAAVPLLLLWLNFSCLIFLIGAEISYTSQNLRNFDYVLDSENISNRYKNYLTYFVTYVIVKRFEQNESPYSVEDIVEKYKMPIRIVNRIINTLKKAEIISEVTTEDYRKVFQPAIDINQLSLKLMESRIDMRGSELFLESKNEQMDAFWQKMLQIQSKTDKITETILLKDL